MEVMEMEKIIIEIDEIELRNIEPNSFLDRDSLEEKKFTFTAILKSRDIDQIIKHARVGRGTGKQAVDRDA